MTRFLSLSAALLLAASSTAVAQTPNPRGELRGEIGGVGIAVDYGRPGLGDRMLSDLMAMLPPDRVWRAGENQVTILETTRDLLIGGQTVSAGRYSVYLRIAEEGDWSLLLNSHQGIPLGELWSEAPEAMRAEPWPMLSGYAAIAEQEVARIALTEVDAAGEGQDIFEITLDGSSLRFAWGGVAWETTVAAP